MESLCDHKTGLAFSGGGVRSAAFCSGVLRRLLQKRVAIDYLSSVSGGGYTGASYMDWKYRNGKKDDPAWHKEYFENLRRHSNQFCDCFNPLRGIVDAVFLVVVLLFLSIGLSLIKAFSFIIPVTFIVDSLFGDTLRDQFTCCNADENRVFEEITRQKQLKSTQIPNFGPEIKELLQISLPMLTMFVISYYLTTVIQQRTVKYFLTFQYRISGFGFAMVFLPWCLQLYEYFAAPSWVNYAVLGFFFAVWIFIPSLKDEAFTALIALVYAYGVKWTVFKTPLAGVEYTDELYWMLVWISVVLLWIHPYLDILQMYGAHLLVEWRLMRALFSPESKAAICCHSTKGKKPLTLADLKEMQPNFECSVTVNQWRRSDKSEKDYEILTFSPTVIERIDRNQDEVDSQSKGFIKPEDLRLSSVMTTSASVFAYDDGEYQKIHDNTREIRVVLGFGFGNHLVAQTGLTKNWMPWVVTFFVQGIFGSAIIAFPIALYVGTEKLDLRIWKIVMLVLLVSYYLLFGFIAILPIRKKGVCTTLIRWCIINVLPVRILRTLFDITDVGITPPPVWSLSDGGHTENLGLLPLLKLRLPRIVIVNGGALSTGGTYATSLLDAMKQARNKLRCSFSGLSGRDIVEDIRDNFVETEKGKQPRSYRFKVQYYEKDGYDCKLVGEGEVLMLMPRHPDDGMKQFQDYKWSDFDADVKLNLDESAWGPGPALTSSEVDRLSGCCFECCHSKRCIPIPSLGKFPFHATLNQLFTSSQYTAYHREGYHACVEAEVAEFLNKCRSSEVVTVQPQGTEFKS